MIPTTGALDFWKINLAHLERGDRLYNVQTIGDPDVGSSPSWDSVWRHAERGAPHSGVLTMPAFLLRFQTNRSRANRAYFAFRNRTFEPPSEPDVSGCVDPKTSPCQNLAPGEKLPLECVDLTKRCYCRSCHQLLEPMAASFAQVAELGSSAIDPAILPSYDEECVEPIQGNLRKRRYCRRFYLTDPNHPRAGWRSTHLLYGAPETADAIHQMIRANVDAGPGGFAESLLDSANDEPAPFFRATAEHVFVWLIGRPPLKDPGAVLDETDLIEQLSQEFAVQDDFAWLMKEIVLLPEYRRTAE